MPDVKKSYCRCGGFVKHTSDARGTVRCKACGTSIVLHEKGLGDYVAAMLNAIGGDHLAKLYERLTGKRCGCKKRQAWLNQLGSRIAARFRRG